MEIIKPTFKQMYNEGKIIFLLLPIETRKKEAAKILAANPDRIPVVAEKIQNDQENNRIFPDLDENK